MKNCESVWLWCNFAFILGVILTATASPLDEMSLENFPKVTSKNYDQHPLKVHNSNQEFTSICWAESLIITEDKKTKNQSISKSYSIILDTPEKLKQLHNESENATCVEILGHNSKPKRALNFTILEETKEYIKKEHKTLFCGAGPVLSQHFIVWPKLNRRQIEISINPLSSTKWKNCKDIQDIQDNLVETEDNSDQDDKDNQNDQDNQDDDDNQEDQEYREDKKRGLKITKSIKGSIKKPNRRNSDDSKINADGSSKGLVQSVGDWFNSNNSKKAYNKSQDSGSSEENDQSTNTGANTNTGAMHSKDKKILGVSLHKPVKNYITRREVNCPVDSLGACKKMIEKSNKLLGYKNSSQSVLGKWFFLDPSDLDMDGEQSFKVKVKVIVNVENALDEKKRTRLVLDEDCLYFLPESNN